MTQGDAVMLASRPTTGAPPALRSPHELRERLTEIAAFGKRDRGDRDRLSEEVARIDACLGRAEAVQKELQRLSESLFEHVLRTVQEKLTLALREVFGGEPIALQAQRHQTKRGEEIRFSILRDGKEEDVLEGQGGSVINVLSVGLRMFALATQDPARHRPFLVLDEQDCWLRPDLVPRLVKIIALAAKELGLQVVIISHHDPQLFAEYADKAYTFVPAGDHVTVRERPLRPSEETIATGALADASPEDVGHGLAPALPLEVVAASGAQLLPLEVPALADHGIRLARLARYPSVLLILGEEPLEVPNRPNDSAALAVLGDGSVCIDQAHLHGTLEIRSSGLGIGLTLVTTPDRSLAYDLSILPAATNPPEPCKAASAVAEAQQLEHELRAVGGYSHVEDSGWRTWLLEMFDRRGALERTHQALSATSRPRLAAVLARIDECGRRLIARITAEPADESHFHALQERAPNQWRSRSDS